MQTLIRICALCVLVSWTTWSVAGDRAAAEALFEEGRRLMRAGQLDAACEKLAASMDEDASVGTLLNLGQCNERRGRTATAWVQYQDAEKLAKQLGDDERAEVARALAAKIHGTLSNIIVEAPHFEAGTRITRDGMELQHATFGVPVPVDPGVHRVEASAPDKITWSIEVRVAPASDQRVIVPALTGAPSAVTWHAAPTPNDDADGMGALGYAGIAVAAIGVVAIAAGIALGTLARNDRDTALPHCPENACDDTGFELVESARDKAHGSTAAFVIGGTALTGGVVMIVGGVF